MRRYLKRHGAFTLVELLVVMGILSILMAMLLTVLFASRVQARKGQARADVDQLVTAWTQFMNDYNYLPPGITMMDEDAIAILRGDAGNEYNTKRTVYMDFRAGGTYFCDPWGTHNTPEGVYRVALDSDRDNRVTVNGQDVYVSVAAWSGGPDGDPATEDDNIMSWKRR